MSKFIGYPTRLIGLAWHDVTCPEGAACRSRELHAASADLLTSGKLEQFLHRLFEMVAMTGRKETMRSPEIEEKLRALNAPKRRWWRPAEWSPRTPKR